MKFSVDAIIFDFDGVLVESNEIRTEGFRRLLTGRGYPEEAVEQLVAFHENNGGLSRYHKLRYLHEKILNEQITEDGLNSLCNEFSMIVKQAVADAPWVKGADEFLKENFSKFSLFIASGSDQNELRDICRLRGIDRFVKDILGSPVDKKTNVNTLLSEYNLSPDTTLFVGDSINDLEAAAAANLKFIARHSENYGEWCKGLAVIKNLTELNSYINKDY